MFFRKATALASLFVALLATIFTALSTATPAPLPLESAMASTPAYIIPDQTPYQIQATVYDADHPVTVPTPLPQDLVVHMADLDDEPVTFSYGDISGSRTRPRTTGGGIPL